MASPQFTVIGTPISTFTRSITLALTYKGITFDQVDVVPHSDIAYKNHPFGFLPTLVIHEIDGKKADLKLRESQAIARYIDRIAPEPSLNIVDGDGHALIAEQMWEFVSFAGAYGFPAVELGVVKPRLVATDKGKLSDDEIRRSIAPGVDQLRKFLEVIEHNMSTEGYVFGGKLTWADFFLFPLLADLMVIPESEILSPRLLRWMEKMDQLDAVQKTKVGTLSALDPFKIAQSRGSVEPGSKNR